MSNETKFWRCIKEHNGANHILNAVYHVLQVYGCGVQRLTHFEPWIPRAGDWVKHANSVGAFNVVKVLAGNPRAVHLSVDDGPVWFSFAEFISPVLHKAPAGTPQRQDSGSGVAAPKEKQPCAAMSAANPVAGPAKPEYEFIGTGTFIRHDKMVDPSRDYRDGPRPEDFHPVLVFEHCVMIDYLSQETKVHAQMCLSPEMVRKGVDMVEGRRYRLEVKREGERIEIVAGIVPPAPDYIGAEARQVAAMLERRRTAEARAEAAAVLKACEKHMATAHRPHCTDGGIWLPGISRIHKNHPTVTEYSMLTAGSKTGLPAPVDAKCAPKVK